MISQDVSTDALIAELALRHGASMPDAAFRGPKPECSSGERGAYDTPLHVFALILILVLSTLACAIPLLSTRRSGASAGRPGKPSTVIFISQHFGTGVLIATAFVHLLPTAFTSLTDPCLPDAFNIGYRPLAGLVAMVSALAVVWVEQYLATRGAGHSHAHHHHGWEEVDANGGDEEEEEEEGGSGNDMLGSRLAARRNVALHDDIETRALVGDASPLPGVSPLAAATPMLVQTKGKRLDEPGAGAPCDSNLESSSRSHSTSHSDSDSDDDINITLDELEGSASRHKRMPSAPAAPLGAALAPTPDEHHRMVLQCMLLEAGILFHSVFIGMALSVASGPTFVVFLIAISFHQSFEGVALGSRIAALHYPRSSPRPWLMVLAYGTTTPVGQALGLALHRLYDPRSVAGLLMVGFMNAISAGLLLFAGLVQLLAEDFLSERSYRVLRGNKRNWAFAAVGSGGALMALVGAFA